MVGSAVMVEGFFGAKDQQSGPGASYMARYIAKNIIAAKLAEKCEVQLAYAIGVPEPVSVLIDTKGYGKKLPLKKIEQLVKKHFSLTLGYY